MSQGQDNSVIDAALELRMQAHEHRLFLDACASGGEHPDYLRMHGRKLNEALFGIAADQAATHKNSKKRRQTCGRMGYDPELRSPLNKTARRCQALLLRRERQQREDDRQARVQCGRVIRNRLNLTSTL